jgi:hypothetical protein
LDLGVVDIVEKRAKCFIPQLRERSFGVGLEAKK